MCTCFRVLHLGPVGDSTLFSVNVFSVQLDGSAGQTRGGSSADEYYAPGTTPQTVHAHHLANFFQRPNVNTSTGPWRHPLAKGRDTAAAPMSDSDGCGGSTASSRKRANSSGGDRSSPSPPRNDAAGYGVPGVSSAPPPAPAPAPTPSSKKKQKKGSRGSNTGVQAFIPPVCKHIHSFRVSDACTCSVPTLYPF